jgi:hypothetical protein
MTTNLSNVEIDEISILSKDVRPAVRAARIAIVKTEIPMSEPISFPTFESAMAHLRKAHGMSALDALAAAARQHPELVKRYNDEGTRIAKAAIEEIAKARAIPQAVEVFNKRVEEVMARDKVNKLDALPRAAREFPQEFAKFQEA